MPIRPARWTDIPIMARVWQASFNPDRLFEVLFPLKDKYPEDMATACRRSLRIGWWDYSKVMMVSYVEITPDEIDSNNQSLVTVRNGHHEVVTGMAKWGRNGLGWESVWNVWGWYDPRMLFSAFMRRYFKLRNKIAFWLRPCRASPQVTKEDPEPLLYGNFRTRVTPFTTHLVSSPFTPWRKDYWELEVLALHPDFQGRGHGRELTEWGLARAKCDTASGVTGLPALVIASEDKEQFYQKVGFNELVGFRSKSVEGVPGVNPLEERGVGGQAVLWSWINEDREAAKKKAKLGKA